MTARAKKQWESVYPELSKEHSGLAGCIILQQLEAQQRITIAKQKNGGRPRLVITLRSVSGESVISEKSEDREFSEKREEVC